MMHTNECPLCGKVLLIKKASGVTVYSCPAGDKSHYELERDAKETIQHFYAFPYAIDNFNNSTKSRIYLWDGAKWKFLREIARIEPGPSEKLLERLQKVISFHDSQ